MKTLYFNNVIDEDNISLALATLEEKPGAAAKQIALMRAIRKKAGFLDIGYAVFLMAVGAGGSYFFFWEIGSSPHWGLCFMGMVCVVMSSGGFALLLRGIKRLTEVVLRPETTGSNGSLLDICTRFYHEALCKANLLGVSGEVTGKNPWENQFVHVSQLFPYSVLEKYAKTGWSAFDENPYFPGPVNSLECDYCHKKTHSAQKTRAGDIGSFKKDSMFAKCDYCGKVLCYTCGFNFEPKERRALCPFCGKATGGSTGLSLRWSFCLHEFKNNIKDFGITEVSKINIGSTVRSDPRVLNIDVSLIVKPDIRLHFNNVAIKIDDNYFLISPEPGSLVIDAD